MNAGWALIWIVGCYTDPKPPAVPRVERVVVHDTRPCLSLPPPNPPVMVCVDPMSPDECREIDNAAWADYGKELNSWVWLYAWPACRTP